MRTDDADREAFYALERAARNIFEPENPPDLDAATLGGIVERLFALAGRRPYAAVAFRFDMGRETGACVFGERGITIWLPPGRCRPWCAVHEASHALTPGTGHGSEFADLCLRGWAELVGWPAPQLKSLAAEYGVKAT